MKVLSLLGIIIIIVLSASTVTYYIYNINSIENMYEIPIDVKVASNFGLNTDTDSLRFGKIFSA